VIDSIIAHLLEDDDGVIAVDFDGTLATHPKGKYKSTKVGDPVPKMVNRVRRWVGRGKKVKIFTARADDEIAVNRIKKWLKDNELPDLEITNVKSPDMIEFWDDRAVEVEKDTGEVKESVIEAILGKEIKPAVAHIGDTEDEELENASRQPFTAYDMALRRGRHHPRLWKSIQGSPYERQYRQKFNPTEALDAPTPEEIQWFLDLLESNTDRFEWGIQATGHIYKIDKNARTVTLVAGSPDNQWHQKTKQIFEVLDFTVDDSNPEQSSAIAPDEPLRLYQPFPFGHPSEWRGRHPPGYSDVDTQEPDGNDIQSFAEGLLQESPEFKTLKKHAVKLTPEERARVIKAGAVWHHGLGGKESPAVRKSVVNGKTWYWCATHRMGQVRKSLEAAIKAFPAVEETS
jgi:hypothetical protein